MRRVFFISLLFCAISRGQISLKPVTREEIRVGGDLSHRILLNFSRLNDAYYEPAHLAEISPDWPGDAMGREILALTLLAQSTGTESPRLAALIDNVRARLNERGYLGAVLPDGVENEQYLSGHSWLLRGLCEHYLWKHDERSLTLIRRIEEGLLLPAARRYAQYPIRADDRPRAGKVAGNITHAADGWQLSSDVGCAFIMLDGATQAYDVRPSPELDRLIKEMIARFAQIDLVDVAAQTHATLSALRGVLRFYASHPQLEYLELVKRTYALYFDTATTEHYANYNWFTRPQWTEACAVVDSYMLATQLFIATRDPRYLEDAQLIYYNALCHAQRPNGGFGCDLCVGSSPAVVILKPHEIYEAPFCCSMRGAEGLTAATTYSYLTSGRDNARPEIVLPIFCDNTAKIPLADGSVTLTESTAYPLEGSVRLTVGESTVSTPVTLRMFIPSWTPAASIKLAINGAATPAKCENSFLTVTRPLAAGDQIELTFEVGLRKAPALHEARLPGRTRYFHGPLLLGQSPSATTQADSRDAEQRGASDSFTMIAPAVYRSAGGGMLSPIRDLTYRKMADAVAVGQQLLFTPREPR